MSIYQRPANGSGGTTTVDLSPISAALDTKATAAAVAGVQTAVDSKASQASVDAIAGAVGLLAAASGALQGEVRTFRADQVPGGWTPSLVSTKLVPGGVGSYTQLALNGSGYGDAGFVSEGAGAGIWRLLNNTLQKYSAATGKAEGLAYPVPGLASSYYDPALCVIGRLLLVAHQSLAEKLYVFDTAEGSFTRLPDLPVSAAAWAPSFVALADGRALLCSRAAGADGAGSVYFALVDPTGVAATVLVSATMGNSTYINSASGVVPLPGGNGALLVGGTLASGVITACTVTVSGDTLTVGPSASTGVAAVVNSSVLIPTATGAYYGSGSSTGTGVAYVAATGAWAPVDSPVAYGSASTSVTGRYYDGFGWLLPYPVSTGGGGFGCYAILQGSPLGGAALVDCIKD